jgi:hypothetical protein
VREVRVWLSELNDLKAALGMRPDRSQE